MENTLQVSRLGKLFNKHMRENLKFYAGCALVFLALQTCVYFFNLNVSRDFMINYEDQMAFFAIGMYLGLFIITVISFTDYNHPRSIFPAIMLPASTFEKYILRWFITLVGYTLVAWALYHLTQSFFSAYLPRTFFFWHLEWQIIRWGLLIYALVHSVAFLGAISFRKRTLVSTALVTFITFLLFMYLNHRLTLTEGTSIPFPFLPLMINTVEGPAKVAAEDNETWAYLTIAVLTVILWVTAYFKLKEREV